MSKPITTIVTIPNMIAEPDWQRLSGESEVRYIEREKVSPSELIGLIKDSDFVMLNRDVIDELDEDFYRRIAEEKLPLKAISADITGMSWAAPEFAKKYGIILMNTPNYSTTSVAEFSLATLLVMIKKMDSVWRDRIAGLQEQTYKNDVLEGKTIGIVGLGNIGAKLAELLTGFGVNIIAWDRKEKHLPGIKQVTLEQLMQESDYVSIHLKTAPDTTGMFNTALLKQAKSGQLIVNEADGKLVDNDNLYTALKSGHLGGYAGSTSALAGHALANLENVVTFPSQAWFTEHSLSLLRKIWVDNITSVIDGHPQNLVD